jgi:hypothetical protein
MQKLHNWSQLRLCTCPGRLVWIKPTEWISPLSSGEGCLIGVGYGFRRFPPARIASSELDMDSTALLRRRAASPELTLSYRHTGHQNRKKTRLHSIRNAGAYVVHIYAYLSFIALSISRFISFCFNASRLS